jgi:hypothetical protein
MCVEDRPLLCAEAFIIVRPYIYWSLWKGRWASTGPFGRTVLSIDDALRFIAHEDIFWVIT